MTLDQWFSQNEDWRPYADLVVLPPLPEELMRLYHDVSPEVLARCGELVSENGGAVTRGAIYVRVRREDKNSGDRWATMLCLQAPPGINTSDTFWAGRKSWVDVFGEGYANRVKAGLAKKGINLLPGQEYMPELVRPGYGPHNPDPQAVVPFGGARSYIKRLCDSRGWSAEGAVTVKGREPESDPHTPGELGDDIVRQKAVQMIEKDPSLKKLTRRDIRAKVLERFSSGPK
jgi:hypothetical protein